MAVTAPTAPTAPTPPTPPQVLFEGGGSVRESNVPVSQQQTNDERLESQARAAVARGDGALSKTTQEKPQAQNDAASGNVSNNNAAQSAGQNAPAGNNAVATGANGQTIAGDSGAADETQQQTQAPWPEADASGHGVLYWGATILCMAILAGLILRLIMKRRGAKSELTWQDINAEVPTAPSAVPGETVADNLRGLTPDEALATIEREEREAAESAKRREHEEMLEARRAAKARLQAAGLPVRGAETPTATETATREYRRELTRMVPQEPEKRAKPLPPLKPTKPRADGEESERFEVRI